MVTSDGPKVVEFNCRFGDPETEAILPLLETNLLELVGAVARGESLAGAPPLRWQSAACVTTVLAAAGYPDAPRKGDVITLPELERGQLLFHAGTARDDDGHLVTSGGRVLCATALGATFDEARRSSASLASRVGFAGSQFRRDIGWRESARESTRPQHAGTPGD
jgi:phosphoribosylamine--glycine ligase